MADLVGRRVQREAVDELLRRAPGGHSASLVVRGEAGIGKTALLEHARGTAAASGFRVESLVGIESETEFAFAGVHQLCASLMDRAGALPEPQQAALHVAFGLREGAVPDRFLVGLAVLHLLAEVAEEGPLLCLVDDAQWLDQASAQVLAFVARRLAAERVLLVFALRDGGDDGSGGDVHPFAGLPEVRLDGLEESDARALLATAVGTPLDDGVRDRVVAEARGNPLALLELPRDSQGVQLAGGFALPEVSDIPRRVEDGFRRRSATLPAQTQTLLLIASAEPTGEVALLWRAGAHLGIAPEAITPAEEAGLLEIDTRVRFRHPLVRSAVYRAATPPDQRRAHSALAAATDPQLDPDRRAWHRSQAALGTDEAAAAELERSAGRARARGGLAAGAAFLQHAAELTPDPVSRARRALDAAHAKHEAGASEAALELLTVAAAGPLEPLQTARVELLRAQIRFHLTRDREGPGLLLDAATTLAPLDPALSRETYLHALDAAIITGGHGPGRGVREVADAARAAPAPPGPPGPADLLLDGLVTTFTRGYAAGVPGLRRALQAFHDHEPVAGSASDSDNRRWLWHASRTATALFDDEAVHALGERHVRLARDAGALATLPAALLFRSVALVLSGEFARAAELADEQTAITAATKAVQLRHAQLILAAWRGRPDETAELEATIVREAAGRGHGTEVALAQYALAVLHNGLGNHPAAQEAAARACESDELNHSNLALPELIEAASRAGQPEHAVDALEQLSSRACASGTSWGLGLAARSTALTSTGADAEEYYREAIAPGGPSSGRPGAAAHRPRAAVGHGRGGIRRAGRPRAAGHRRAPPHPHRPADRRAHRPREAHRPTRGDRCDVPGGRHAAVPEPAHDRGPPAQHLPQARHHLPPAAAKDASALTIGESARAENLPGNLTGDLEVEMERFVGVEDARGSLGRLVDEVAKGGDVVALTKRGKALAVLMSRDEYAELKLAATERARSELTESLGSARRAVREAGLDVAVIDEALAAARRL